MVGGDERILQAMLVLQLRKHGGVGASAEDLGEWGVTPQRWQALAGAAARELGRPAQTFRTGDGVWAQLSAWPANELEQQLLRERLRRAVEGVALLGLSDAVSEGRVVPLRPMSREE